MKMNKSKSKSWLLIAFIVGVGLPILFVELDENRQSMWVFMSTFMILSNLVIFKKIAKKYPLLYNWQRDTLIGETTIVFLFFLLGSTLSLLFAMLPITEWLHNIVAGIFGLFAMLLFGIFYIESKKDSEE